MFDCQRRTRRCWYLTWMTSVKYQQCRLGFRLPAGSILPAYPSPWTSLHLQQKNLSCRGGIVAVSSPGSNKPTNCKARIAKGSSMPTFSFVAAAPLGTPLTLPTALAASRWCHRPFRLLFLQRGAQYFHWLALMNLSCWATCCRHFSNLIPTDSLLSRCLEYGKVNLKS